jgi:glycolate oxidase
VKLIRRPECVITLLALFSDVRAASSAVAAMTSGSVTARCIEFFDQATLAAMRKAGNPLDPRAGSLLLIEVDGSAKECETAAERVGAACEAAKALEILVAQDAGQRERLWSARREMSYAVRQLSRHKLSEDVVVPRQQMATLLDRVSAISERTGVRTLTYGHAGDGNLHVNFLWDREDEVPAVDRAIGEMFREVVGLGGTLSGEHGIGVLKAAYLPLEQSTELIALQKDLKRVFDPSGLLNPGKIFPASSHRAC